MEEKSQFETFELSLSNNILGMLKETTNWTYFLSIIGFIGIGLMLLVGIVMSAVMGSMSNEFNPYQSIGFSPAYIGLIYVIMAAFYFFPVLYLFNFSRKMKAALRTKSNDDLTAAFSNLKSHYKFLGIFTIVVISIYVLILFFAMIGAAAF